MRIEERGEPLVGAGAVEAAAAQAEGQHEDVDFDGLRAEVHAGWPPVELTLRAGRRLEAPLRQVDRLRGAERAHEALHRLVAPGVAVVPPELLERIRAEYRTRSARWRRKSACVASNVSVRSADVVADRRLHSSGGWRRPSRRESGAKARTLVRVA